MISCLSNTQRISSICGRMREKVVEELENNDNVELIPKAPELNFEEPQIIFKRHLVD